MEVGAQVQRLYKVQIQKLLLILGIIGSVAVLLQLFVFPYESFISTISHATKNSVFVTVGSATLSSGSKLPYIRRLVNSSKVSGSEDKENDYYLLSNDDEVMDNSLEIDEDGQSQNGITSERNLDLDKSLRMKNVIQADNRSSQLMGLEIQLDPNEAGFGTRTPLSSAGGIIPSAHDDTQLVETQSLLQTVSVSRNNNSFAVGYSIAKKRGSKSTSISQMTTLLLQSSDSSTSVKPRWSSPRDRELQFARIQIENAPIIRKSPELYASLFRNVSMFKRSYELMERMLKVYVYKEGHKPIFHQPYLRGIYASEGWFMKLIEGNKQFVTRDPRKAHLFYLPFSSLKLRTVLYQETFAHQKDLEKYLKNYTDIIAKKYFWKRAGGADHFLVACHDWAPRITREDMGSCIRALCNTNIARGFKIGKDVSLPVTNIRSSQNPQKDLGGKPPSERPILAFFAGGMHGYLRPILLKYWENKEPDMKIFGPMPRDIEGKTKYREYMKSSKYCICARGYEVHTPRVVESIYYECVPVIISDNYVPPFFEVLDWEAFSIFVLEEDIPNLRNILLSIPEEKYLAMQQRVKMVQQHFLWHKKAVKYDLFHMILHSVWYNRVFQT